ncbi:CoA pyrophosphatase [bacterium]|nr:CoA pyrophosphatase [bacterium]
MNFIEQIEFALTQPLPGSPAQNIMSPEGRNLLHFTHKFSAAVMIALYRENEQWRFPLIKRAEDDFAHSGQIGLPGGKMEPGETIIETALRETEEEIGIKPEFIKVIGQLTELQIPVSSFLVHPVVGVMNCKPEWILECKEVDEVFTVSLDDVCNPDLVKSEMRRFKRGPVKVPYFRLYGHKVWGATAMILSEFGELLKN